MGIKKDKVQSETAALRRRANDRLKTLVPKERPPWTEHERQRLLHELDVHQIELEMQNEELRRSRDELEKSCNAYSELYDFAPVSYLTIDRAGAISTANLTASSLLGVERARLIGRRFGKYVADESRAFFSDFLAKVLAGQGKESCEVTLSSREGKAPRIVQIEAVAFDSGDRCRAAIIDVTERKMIEEKLRNSEKIYRAIGESIEYGVWVCDPDGRNTYASKSFLELVGFTQEQCADFGWKDVLHPDDVEQTIAAWKECVRTGGKWDIEHRFRGVDGQWHPILARGVQVLNDHGKIVCWAGINLDISRFKEAEEGILRYAEEMGVLNEEMRRFNQASVGRELRMIELKKEINELCIESGKPPRYPLDFEKA
jgi:PAS domain S-box-containing protein